MVFFPSPPHFSNETRVSRFLMERVYHYVPTVFQASKRYSSKQAVFTKVGHEPNHHSASRLALRPFGDTNYGRETTSYLTNHKVPISLCLAALNGLQIAHD